MNIVVPKSKNFIKERKQEYYYKKAKEESYRSRATYKLSQTIAKYHFIKYGNVVVDLGAAPGGWIQAARKVVGKNRSGSADHSDAAEKALGVPQR